MKSLLELIKLLYGPKAISSTIGTRTNVIRLPSGNLQKYLSKELDIESASTNAAKNAYLEMHDLIPEVAKMNDGERLVFEGNLRRLKNKLEDSGLLQGENVSSGITDIQSKIDKLKIKRRELEKATGEKATLTDVLNDMGASQQSMSRLNDEGLVRAAARQILINDIKAGKIKNITVSEAINMGEPLDPFRQIYGEGALEQLDSLIPNLRGLKTEIEAEKLARSKFKFEPDENRLPGSTSIEEGRKAEQEFGINKPAKVSDFKAEATKRTSIDDLIDEYNANQDRLRLSDEEGGTAIGYQEFKNIQKRNEDIAKALEEKGISSKVEEKPQAEIIQFRKKPTEPEGKANGGAMGLDYLTGQEPPKNGYAGGGRIGFKTGSGKKILDIISKTKKPVKEFTDDEMIAYIKKYKEEGPTLEEFTKKINKETGSNFTPEQLKRVYGIKIAYPHSTPIVDSQGKYIGGALYNPPLDVSISDTETLTKSIMQTRKAKGLDAPEKAGEGKFTKQEVLEKIIQKTIDANPTDEYIQKTFPNFIKEIKANPELAKSENVWKTFTQDFPENKKLVVYGDDTVDFFTKGENLPEGMKQTKNLADTYGISMQEAMRIKQMEPTDQVMEIKKLQVLKSKTQKETKYKQGDAITEENFGDTPFAPDLSGLEEARRMTKGMSLEDEMNKVLNQYDKSMFVKNEQGMVDVTNPENVQKMALLLKRDHPEIYKKLEEGMPINTLEDFDVTGRKPNAKGGLNYLTGF